jgi:hypothetical protein
LKPDSSGDSRSHYKGIILALIVLLWITIVVGLYYVGHKPFSASLALNLIRSLWQLLVALAVVSISGGLGLRIIRKYCNPPMIRIALPAALGIGIIGTTMLLISSFLGISQLIGWMALIILAFIMRRDIFKWLSYWRDLSVLWEDSSWLGRSFAIGVAVILSATLTISLAPPIKFDALVYHLTLPKIYVEAGRFSYVPEIMFWGMPQLGELFYTWTFSLFGVKATTVTGWLIGVLALIGLAGYVDRIFNPRTTWIALASLLIGATASLSISWGYVDWFAFLFGWCVLFTLDSWRIEYKRGYLLLAGIFAGFALGVKYTAGVILLSGIVIIIIGSFKSRTKYKNILVDLGAFILPSIVVSLPWWIKNVFGTGNPFYPFFYPSGAMTEFRQSLYTLPPVGNLLDALMLPWNATILGIEGAPGYSASIGPLFLGLGFLTWIGWSGLNIKQKNAISTAVTMGIASLIVWTIASQFSEYLLQSRIYFAIFPAFAFLAGVGFHALGRINVPYFRVQRVVAVFVLILFWFAVVEVAITTLSQGSLQVLLNIQEEDKYLENNLGWYAPASTLIHDLPTFARVVMLWEPRSYECVPRCDPDEILDRWLFELEENGSPEAILSQWQEAGYTHLLYNQFGADFVRQNDPRYNRADWDALDYLLSILPAPVDIGGSYYLYELEP